MTYLAVAVAVAVALLCTSSVLAVRINEVSDKGTSPTFTSPANTAANPCPPETDWIELYNSADEPVNLAGYTLHDDRGPFHPEALVFPSAAGSSVSAEEGMEASAVGRNAGTVLQPGGFLLICAGIDPNANAIANTNGSELSAQFGVGGTDTVSLLDASGSVVSTTGNSLDGSGAVDVTLAYDDTTETYAYTATPTPGAENVIASPNSPEALAQAAALAEQQTADLKSALEEQNELATKFFNFDSSGRQVADALPEVVDLRLTLTPEAYAALTGDERGYEVYSPLMSATVTPLDQPDEVLWSSGEGREGKMRMRPKGQSTMYLGVCTNKTTPYQIDWDSDSSNANSTLFGMTKTYLRTAWGDGSFSREWAAHRMLARFGLPHLRTRSVRLVMNDVVMGLYTMMEAPDQDYVFARSFPDFDPATYGLYKVKTQAIGCGVYDEKSLSRAYERVNETTTPPYAFERGTHRPLPPVMGTEEECLGPFIQNLAVNEFADVELAYVRYQIANPDEEGKCGNFLVDQGLVDRDLGDSSRDALAAEFVDDHLADNACSDSECSNSNLAEDVDVSQFLRNMAAMAVLLHQDSPLGNGNNWYMAYPGDGLFKMVQYDHNNMLSETTALLCDAEQCFANLMQWSIVRPTCRSLESNQLAGPLLADDALHAEYVEYVREFVDEVATNEEFITQVEQHLASIKGLVSVDPWNDFAQVFEEYEMGGGDEWLRFIDAGLGEEMPRPYIPFLPALRARAADVQMQLAALDGGTYPREDQEEYNPGEACANWSSDAPDFACHNNCYYEGCSGGGLTTQAFCDPESGSCFQGFLDFDCIGVTNGQPKPGTSFEEGAIPFFCLTFGDFPIQATPCPPYVGDGPADDGSSSPDGSGIDGDEMDEEVDGDVTTIGDSDMPSSDSSCSGNVRSVVYLVVVAMASLFLSNAATGPS